MRIPHQTAMTFVEEQSIAWEAQAANLRAASLAREAAEKIGFSARAGQDISQLERAQLGHPPTDG